MVFKKILHFEDKCNMTFLPFSLQKCDLKMQWLKDCPDVPTATAASIPELIAEALQKYHDVEGDKEVETDDQDVTVFDTITSLMGRDISHLLRRHVVGGEGHIKSSVTWHERDGEKRESVIRSYESARRQSEV